MSWPDVMLDEVARLEVLARARPYLCLEEVRVDLPLDRVWSAVADMETGVPLYASGIERVEILERDGEALRLRAFGRFGPGLRLEAELRRGWCLMWSGRLEIGIAAAECVRTGETRLAHFEGVRGTGPWLRPIVRQKVRRELAQMVWLVRSAGSEVPGAPRARR